MFLLDLSIKALFFTNTWVILYTNLLRLLNAKFPQQINPSGVWAASSPEPFEIPLYIGLTALFVLLTWITDRIKLPKLCLNTGLKLCLLFLLTLLFIYFL